MGTKILFILPILTILALTNCSSKDTSEPPEKTPVITAAPMLKGKLVYHSYTSYESLDSKIYLYDFSTNELKHISDGWNIQHSMNAHFSPDGKQITFMGIGKETDTWDIFLYDISSTEPPINLTPNGKTRDEDPKFSPDGKKIVFKKDGNIAEMNLADKTVKLLLEGDIEYSIPYYNSDGTKLVFTANAGKYLSIMTMDLSTRTIGTLYDVAGIQDYYPINADKTSFYYVSGYSETNPIDQVYRGYWSGLKSKLLPFNETDGDYSDPYPVDDNWVVISSTRAGGLGGYDLYIANAISGEVFPMTDYNKDINTSKDDLGACYMPISPNH